MVLSQLVLLCMHACSRAALPPLYLHRPCDSHLLLLATTVRSFPPSLRCAPLTLTSWAVRRKKERRKKAEKEERRGGSKREEGERRTGGETVEMMCGMEKNRKKNRERQVDRQTKRERDRARARYRQERESSFPFDELKVARFLLEKSSYKQKKIRGKIWSRASFFCM